ncbi:MAG: hypothetical protein R3257_00260 [bacterium]|nr:hypothetical protein [bacterium]
MKILITLVLLLSLSLALPTSLNAEQWELLFQQPETKNKFYIDKASLKREGDTVQFKEKMVYHYDDALIKGITGKGAKILTAYTINQIAIRCGAKQYAYIQQTEYYADNSVKSQQAMDPIFWENITPLTKAFQTKHQKLCK